MEAQNQEHKGHNIMAFTDGLVKTSAEDNLPQTLGYGACASILVPIGNSLDVQQTCLNSNQ